jgi:hypothetical protein
MIAAEHSTKLLKLFRRYNFALQDLYALERIIDNHAIPYPERELRVTEFQKLSKEAAAMLEAIKKEGYSPTNQQIMYGIKE